ncbi:hypothetical protein ACWD25_54985, partial [Streptomyces sp. NPDC002920]
ESGSGKSVTARSLVGLAGAHSSVRATRLATAHVPLLHAVMVRQPTWRTVTAVRADPGQGSGVAVAPDGCRAPRLLS